MFNFGLGLGLGLAARLIPPGLFHNLDFSGGAVEDYSFFRSGDTATIRNSAGQWVSVPANAPRYAHDGNGAPLGQLFEKTAVNKINHANFAPVDVGGITKVTGTNDGTASVVDDSVKLAGATLDGSLFSAIGNGKAILLTGGTTGTTWRVSLDAGSTNNHSFRVIARKAATGYGGTIKLSSGAGQLSWNQTDTNYHDLVSENFVCNATTRYLQAYVAPGQSVYICAMQFEEGGKLSTPIRCTGAAGSTRGSEYGRFDVSNASWFKDAGGSVICDCTFDSNLGQGNQYLFLIGQDVNNGFGMYAENGTGDLHARDAVAGSAYHTAAVYPQSANVAVMHALSWDATSSTVVTKPVVYTRSALPTARAASQYLYVGGHPGGDYFYGYLRSLKIYKKERSIEQLATELYGYAMAGPPPLSGSTRTYSFSYVSGGQIQMTCSDPAIAAVTKLNTEYFFLNVSNTINVILDFPRALRFAGLRLDNCKTVIIQGAYLGVNLKALVPATAENRSMLRINGQAGEVYYNNFQIDCDRKRGMDALEMGAFTAQSGLSWWPTQRISPQNGWLHGMYNKVGDSYHADGGQWYGSAKKLQMTNMDISTDTQGLFLTPQTQYRVDKMSLKNIVIFYERPEIANAYALTLWETTQVSQPAIELDEVYVGERDYNQFSKPEEELWGLYSVNPRVGSVRGAVESPPGVLSFPELDGNGVSKVTGVIKKYTNQSFRPPLLGTGITEITPNAPTGLILTQGTGQFDASWSAPSDNGADVWGYLVKWRLTSASADVEAWEEKIVRAATSTTITGLAANNYDVEVYAMAAYYDSATAVTGSVEVV